MRYRELLPSIELRGVVDCYWILEPSAAGGDPPRRVLPDGCIDVLVDAERAEVSVVGTMTRAIVVPARRAPFVGVRFRPGQAARILRVPATELRDLRVPLDELWADGASELGERVASAESHVDRVRALDVALLAPVRGAPPKDVRLSRALAGIAQGLRVADVAKTTALGERQLHRLFLEHVGIAPKMFGRVMRLLRAVDHLDRGASFADVAFAAGYVDQAHFTRETSDLAGARPSDLRRERGGVAMSDSYKTASAQEG